MPSRDTNQPLSYHHRGLSPIPLEANSKKPAIKWGQYQDKRPTEEQVKRWDFDNTGLLTGETHNLLVVDLDSRKAVKWYYEQFNNLPPITPVVKTNRGIHIYYKYPENLEISKLTPRKNVEILGDKHLVCAPPSTHPSGSRYKWLNSLNVDLSSPPGWLLDTVKSTGAEPRTVNKNPKKPASVSSQDSKSTKKPKKTVNVDNLVSPIYRKEITAENEIFEHKAFAGKPTSDSCNGRFLTLLITAYNTGLDKSKAIQATQDKYPTLDKSTIQDSAKGVYQRGYGLKIDKMVDIGIDETIAKDLLFKVVSLSRWRSKQTENKQMTAKEFNRRLFKASLAFTLGGIQRTTYGQIAELADVSKSTLAQKDELPPWIQIYPQNGLGVKMVNLLPLYLKILINTLTRLIALLTNKQATFTSPLCSKGVEGVGLTGGGIKKGGSKSSGSVDPRAPPD